MKPANQQLTAFTASVSPATNYSFFNAVNNGQRGNLVLNAENKQTMLKNARGEAGHQSPEDDSTDSDSNQLRGFEDMSGPEQLMDAHLFSVLMHEINNGKWKKLFT